MTDVISVPPPSLTVEELVVQLGRFTLRVPRWMPPAGLTMLIGPNGAGKTTLFRTIAGLIPDYVGAVRLNDVPSKSFGYRLPEFVRYMPDTIAGIPTMSVDDHLGMAAAAFGARWDSAYATRLRVRLRLTDDRRVSELSKGNAAKLSFLCAEVPRPPVLLLDEPTAGLDPFARNELLSAIADANREHPSRRVVIATHLLDDLSDLVRALYVLSDGQMVREVDQTELAEFRNLNASSRQARLLEWCPAFGEGAS